MILKKLRMIDSAMSKKQFRELINWNRWFGGLKNGVLTKNRYCGRIVSVITKHEIWIKQQNA